MRDRYPAYPTIPAEHLVPPELQPEYLDVPGVALDGTANAGLAIARDGRGAAGGVAIVHHETGQALTFGDLDRLSARLANALDGLGIRPGERVAYRSANRPEAIVICLACWRLGAVVVPTPAQARAEELRFLLQDTGAAALIVDARPALFAEVPAALEGSGVRVRVAFGGSPDADGWADWDALLERAADTRSDGDVPADLPALIWHTGGTTGVPKACYHTHRRFLAAGHSYGLATGVGPGRRWAAAAPLGHALGFIYHTIFTLLHGATVVTIDEFSRPEVVLDAIERRGVDTFTAIAITWARMLEAMDAEPERWRLPSLRYAYAMWQSASSTAVADRWRQRGTELLNNFGSTAFATWVLVPRPGEPFAPASLGRAAPGYEVRAIDDDSGSLAGLPAGTTGRMAVRGPSGLTYWNRPEAQRRDVRDGWTLVDDLIQFDENGNAAYMGRTDFIISSAGYKIAPVEVEAVLSRHPAVREVAVVGTPDPVRQEIVTAFVALQGGVAGDGALVRDLQDFVRAELAPYKYPRRIEFVDALPRDPVGKVQPRTLKNLAETRAAQAEATP